MLFSGFSQCSLNEAILNKYLEIPNVSQHPVNFEMIQLKDQASPITEFST